MVNALCLKRICNLSVGPVKFCPFTTVFKLTKAVSEVLFIPGIS